VIVELLLCPALGLGLLGLSPVLVARLVSEIRLAVDRLERVGINRASIESPWRAPFYLVSDTVPNVGTVKLGRTR
jgi:hypothetical protein